MFYCLIVLKGSSLQNWTECALAADSLMTYVKMKRKQFARFDKIYHHIM